MLHTMGKTPQWPCLARRCTWRDAETALGSGGVAGDHAVAGDDALDRLFLNLIGDVGSTARHLAFGS